MIKVDPRDVRGQLTIFILINTHIQINSNCPNLKIKFLIPVTSGGIGINMVYFHSVVGRGI